MKTCSRCHREKAQLIQVEDSLEVAGHLFTAQLPADRCDACGEIVIQGHDVKLFELRVAIELAKAGTRNAASFKFLRKALQMEPAGLAELLDIPEEYVSYWERGDWPVDPRAHSVVCSLVMAKYDRTHVTLDPLRVLREPRKLARKVRLTLTDAMTVATKTLQFGSAARTAPALA